MSTEWAICLNMFRTFVGHFIDISDQFLAIVCKFPIIFWLHVGSFRDRFGVNFGIIVVTIVEYCFDPTGPSSTTLCLVRHSTPSNQAILSYSLCDCSTKIVDVGAPTRRLGTNMVLIFVSKSVAFAHTHICDLGT